MNNETLEYYRTMAIKNRKRRNATEKFRYERAIKILKTEAGEIRLNSRRSGIGGGLKKVMLDRVHLIESIVTKIETGALL